MNVHQQRLPDIQLVLRPGIIDFSWGHPDAALLPTAAIAKAAAHTLQHSGHNALAYGAEQGPGGLVHHLCARLGKQETRTPAPEEMLITGGTSQALDLLCTLLTKPGDVVLVESPTYHLALRIFRDHGLQIIAAPSDAHGPFVDEIAVLVNALQRQGQRMTLLYCVPTFKNPTGLSLPTDRRAALVAAAQRLGTVVIEDDAYRELWYDAPPPPPLYNSGPPGPVVRLGSFAKVLAPGLRLGWMLADPAIIRRCVGGGLLDSGGGVNHFTAQVVATFIGLELLDPHIEHLRTVYCARRDHLLAALAQSLPTTCHWSQPGGGYFVWVRLPAGMDSDGLLPQAEAAGVAYLPGTRFASDGGGANHLRLSFSMLSLPELAAGAERLGNIIRHSSAE